MKKNPDVHRECIIDNLSQSGRFFFILMLEISDFEFSFPTAIAVILACSSPAFAEKNVNSAGRAKAANLSTADASLYSKPYGFYLKPMLDSVEADEGQKVKITAVVESYRSSIEPLRVEYRQKREQFLKKVSSGESYEQIMNDQTQLSRLHSQINLYYCQMSLELRKNLNPEQIVLYEEFKRQHGWTGSGISH